MKDAENLKIWIAEGKSRKSLRWRNTRVTWKTLALRFSEYVRTGETVADYEAMTADRRGEVKDVGGFVGGWLEGGSRRCGGNVRRSLLTLDLDSLPPWADGSGIRGLSERVAAALPGVSFFLYSTHSHQPSSPRMRLVIPLAVPVGAEAAEAVGRMVASRVGFGWFDRTTFEASRLFYWPSVSSDGDLVRDGIPGDALDADAFLAENYEDWREVSAWPRHPDEEGPLGGGRVPRLGDPRLKRGVVGAWCRLHPLEEVLRTELKGVYLPAGVAGRYTYAKGTTTGGAVLYDDGQHLWSNHATDPAHGHGRNSFDLVRVHLFGHLDGEGDGDGSTTSPSYLAMCGHCMKDPAVRAEVTAEQVSRTAPAARVTPAPGSPASAKDADGATRDRVTATVMAVIDRGGATKRSNGEETLTVTRDNIRLILDTDPALRSLRYDDFAKRMEADTGGLPWPRSSRQWSDRDDSALRLYLERWYGMKGKDAIYDAVEALMAERTVHPVREWLASLRWDGVPRIRSLFTDVLGADPTPLNGRLAELLMTGMVARVLEPGIKFDYCVTLMGPQGCGKSSFLAALAGQEWFSDSLKDLTNKDAMVSLQGKWLLELGEMTAAKRADDNQVKSFISSQSDCFRPPYGRRMMDFPRQCVMVGTTNDRDFLYSQPGQLSRRLPVVEVRPELRKVGKWPAAWVTENRDMLFAEAYALWTTERPPLWLEATENEEVARIQEGFSKATLDPLRGLIDEWLDRPYYATAWRSASLDVRRAFARGTCDGPMALTPEGGEPAVYRPTVCTAEVVEELLCVDRGRGEFSKQARAVGNLLNNHPDWLPAGREYTDHYGRQRVWRRRVEPEAPPKAPVRTVRTLGGGEAPADTLPF